MKRGTPSSPQRREAELDRALDLLSPPPRLPEGFAARIAADIVRLPQEPAVIGAAPMPHGEAEEPLPAAAVPAVVVPLQPARLAISRRWMSAGAGFAALAAGLAAIAFVGLPPQADLPAAPVAGPAAPSLAAVTADKPAPADPAPARLASIAPSRTPAASRAPQAALALPPEPAPETALQPAPESSMAAAPQALAVALPERIEGPLAVPDDAQAVPRPGARGQMGPVAPQGFGYAGGQPGSIPSGAPVTMSGGPGRGEPGPGPGAGRGGGAHPF